MKVRYMLGATVAAVAVFASAGCSSLQPNDYTLPGQVAVGSDGYTVTVDFNEVANLVPNSAVELNNVVVGTVASIDVSNWQAKVKLRLLKSANIPSNATFSIGQKTLLGAQYVEVALPAKPSPTLLSNGAAVSIAQTGTYPATEQVLGAVALLLNNGGLSQVQTITSQLSTALGQHVPDSREIVRQSNVLMSQLDANKGQLVGALESLNQLSGGLARDQNMLGTAIDRLGPGLQSLEQERQTLVNTVNATGVTAAAASQVITASRQGLLQTVNGLQPILANLQGVATSLPEALKIAVTIPFPVMTTTNALRGDYANLFTTLDLRGDSLAQSWLAGLFQANSVGSPSGASAPTNTPAPPGPATSTPAPASPSGGTTTAPGGTCLLQLLGLC